MQASWSAGVQAILPMPFSFDFVPVAGFTGLMAAAAFEDFRKLVIPNTVVVGLCALWPLHLATGPGFTLAGGLNAVGCALAVFLCGAVLFSRGLIGGGDVKLLAAATLWAGPAATPTLLVVTAVLGGLLTLVLLSSATVRAAFSWARAAAVRSLPVPYGVAIAAAAVIVTVPPNLP
jgi:prepilin peptidase CpaA